MQTDEPNTSAAVTVTTERRDAVLVVQVDRPDRRNAVDRRTAQALADAFRRFDADADLAVAVLYGAGGHFCAGADLKAVAEGAPNRLESTGDAPMGPSRMQLTKPVIAAIEGYAVAGGLELALWCDLRVAAAGAQLGVLCRRWGVPLIDGGTVRLPRIVGLGRALDLILTGRLVGAQEALDMGLVSRVAPDGHALDAALALANQLAAFPQTCLRADRASALQAFDGSLDAALSREFAGGLEALEREGKLGARRFADGAGRHGRPAGEGSAVEP